MLLRDLIDEMRPEGVEGSVFRNLSGLSCDARRVAPGDLFFALTPLEEAQAELAIERGAQAIVCRRRGFLTPRATSIVVPDVSMAMARVSRKFYDDPSNRLQVIGVTGGSGQWNSAFLLKQLLEKAGTRTGLISSMRHEIADRRLPGGRLFPRTTEINQMLHRMAEAGCTACIIELPPDELTADKFAALDFDVLIAAGSKLDGKQLLQWQKEAGATKSLTSIINIDEPDLRTLLSAEEIGVRVTYGITEAAEVRARDLTLGSHGSSFVLEIPGRSFTCGVPLVGRHNIYHLLGAIGAGLSLGIEAPRWPRLLRHLNVPPGNLERVSPRATVYVDEARTPETIRQVLSSIREVAAERVLVVLGADERSTLESRTAMGRVAGEFADHLILTSDNPGKTSPQELCRDLAHGVELAGRSSYHMQVDRAQAIRELVTMGHGEDIMVILGKGERTHQEFADTIVPFDDREHAREALENLSLGRLMPEPV